MRPFCTDLPTLFAIFFQNCEAVPGRAILSLQTPRVLVASYIRVQKFFVRRE
jgi:hypothetical protein